MINPTSCDPTAITGAITSTAGLSKAVSSRFQAGGCAALGFSPNLTLSLTGPGTTRSGAHPTLTATVTQPGGQANIKSAQVTLPPSLALDPTNSQHLCAFDVAQAVHGGAVGCPASTIVGQATAVTPLVDRPLSGPVYLVQGIRFGPGGRRIRTLPSLLIPLRGQLAIDLRATSSVNHSQLVTTFSTVPDAPIGKFTLKINGGRRGLLVITGRGKTICDHAQVAAAAFEAHSGAVEDMNRTLSTACGAPATLLHSGVKRHTVRVTVRVPGPGKLTASGPWLRRQVRLLGRAQKVTLVLHLTNAGIRRLNRVHHLDTQVMLGWTPRGGGLQPMQTRLLTIQR
jgi:hypothetical protein